MSRSGTIPVSRPAAPASNDAVPEYVEPGAKRRPMPLGVGHSRILVVADDPGLLASLEEVAEGQLIELVRASAADALDKALASFPDAAVLELSATSTRASLLLARGLRILPSCGGLPIAFASAETGFAGRVAAARAGGSIYLVKPIEPDALSLALRQLLAARRSTKPRVLMVNGAGGSRRGLVAALERSGKLVTTLQGTMGLVEALAAARPDVLLVELAATEAGGVEICQLIRQSLEWQDLPIVMLVPSDELGGRLAAFRAGADDVLVEPVAEEELAARIDARVDRMRLLRERYDKDPLTELPLRRPFLEHLSRCTAESLRHRRPMTLALLDVDLFKSINDRFGHPAADRALATLGRLLGSRFRAEDLRGRWGGEEFILAFPGASAASVHDAVSAVLNEFASLRFLGPDGDSFQVSFSVGMADFPSDGASVQALLDVADRRLYEAKRRGRAQVVSSG